MTPSGFCVASWARRMISTASAIVFNRSPRGLIRRVAVKAHAPQIPDGIARTALSRVQTRLTATERLDAVLERFELAVITEHAALEFAVQLTDETVLRFFRIGPVERYVLVCVDANPRRKKRGKARFSALVLFSTLRWISASVGRCVVMVTSPNLMVSHAPPLPLRLDTAPVRWPGLGRVGSDRSSRVVRCCQYSHAPTGFLGSRRLCNDSAQAATRSPAATLNGAPVFSCSSASVTPGAISTSTRPSSWPFAVT
jgi:hypothetical protein